jgi:hypothetical protein
MEIVRSTSDDWTYLLNWVREAEYKRYVTGPLSEKVIYSGLFISYKNSLFILRRQGFPAGYFFKFIYGAQLSNRFAIYGGADWGALTRIQERRDQED